MYTFAKHMGNKIYLRDFTKEDMIIDDYLPIYYTRTDHPDSPFKSYIHNKKLAPHYFPEDKKFTDTIKWLEERDQYGEKIFGRRNPSNSFIFDEYLSKNKKEPDSTMVVYGITDIEVHAESFPDPTKALHPINAITYYCSARDAYFCFHYLPDGEWNIDNTYLEGIDDLDINEIRCTDEADLLRSFINVFKDTYPDILSGWNSDTFDYPYIVNRVRALLGDKAVKELSPFGKVFDKKIRTKFGQEKIVDIFGITILDYLRLYKTHTFKSRENYKLETISHVELGDGKLNYDEYSSLHELYEKNPQKFVDYNIKDVWNVKRLDDKLNLFGLVIDMAYIAGVNFEDTFSPTRIWDNLIHNELEIDNIIPPMFGLETAGIGASSLQGAHVKEAKIGKHRWIVSFDLASLYPSIIRQWNLGHETKRDLPGFEREDLSLKVVESKDDKEKTEALKKILRENNLSMSGNGTLYSTKEDSCLRVLMGRLFDERKKAKKTMYKAEKKGDKKTKDVMNTRQMALKILANSGYGALANNYFRFYDFSIAQAITLTGQMVSFWVFGYINDYLNNILGTENKDYIIAGDTDSVYINFEPMVTKFCSGKNEKEIVEFLDKASKHFEKKCLELAFADLNDLLNCSENHLLMEREVIASDGFWRKKKNYALRVMNKEGMDFTDNPKLKILGLEAIKSKMFNEKDRKALEKAIRIILEPDKNNDDLLAFIDEYRKEYFERAVEEIASVQGVNYIKKYSEGKHGVKKGAPKNSRAAINYNNQLVYHGLDGEMRKIEEGDSIYILELKDPNPTKHHVIGFLDFLPREFELDEYIDREGLFLNNFYNPVASYCKVVNWKSDDAPDLFDFF